MKPPHDDGGAEVTLKVPSIRPLLLVLGMMGFPALGIGVYHQYKVAPAEAQVSEAVVQAKTATEARISRFEAMQSDIQFLRAQAEFHGKSLDRIEAEQRDTRSLLMAVLGGRGPRPTEAVGSSSPH